VLVKAFEFTRADRGVILLFNDQGGLEPRCYQNRHGDDETVELSETIISEVMQKRNAVLSSDAMVDSRFGGAHSIIMQGIRSTMCVPLMVAQEILGMIHLDTKIATGVFQEKDLQVLTVFAQQAAVRIANVRLAKRAEDEAVVRTNLSRLLSPNLVDEVVRGNVAVEKGGVLRRASVLFIDIRGFTGMSERLAPQDMVTMLNEYFEIMVEIVFKYEGTLDKFIGDEIMAVWGAPVEQEDDAERAVRAALDMIRELNRFNTFRLANGEQAIRVGCGINCGDIVAGYMGSSRTLSYTVIGDVVNTAARLCSHAQAGQILISDAVATRLADRFQLEPLPDATLKGKSRPVKVLQVHAER
jgi:adenylate cyclase